MSKKKSPYLKADQVSLVVHLDGSNVDLIFDFKKKGKDVYEPGVASAITNIRFASKEDAYMFERLLRTLEYNQPDLTVMSTFTLRGP